MSYSCRIKLAALCLVFGAVQALASEPTINIYNWSDNIGTGTVAGFEKASGIKIKYDVYDGDDTLIAKLLTGRTGYDVVYPSTQYFNKEVEAGIFQKIDQKAIPNLAKIDKQVAALTAGTESASKYAVPYTWGTDGFGFNLTAVKAALGANVPLDSWDILFKPEYISKLSKCGVSILDSPSDVLPLALFYLHKDPNSKNPADWQAAYQLFKTIRPYITQFNSSGYINDLANNDICMAVAWSGDVGMAGRRAREAGKPYKIAYVLPKEGAPIWSEMMAIPKDAAHAADAMKWLNYIMDPKVSADITRTIYYPLANAEAKQFLPADILNDPAVYPGAAMMQKLWAFKTLPTEIMRLQTRLWTQLKTGR
ncbi:polyamine ABC transporter substrate-binding protein [Vogesella sp. LIG4]|uniref:polyamine ABC transporter substrate-binding protein n=1 Tax=Vogesella sp. LIG4 TaxID=1192162 RepID=UPI00081F9294|nr:polyamine ABC transporter substrate-binding protein [Vogesella sp. LIG4]SCK18052.1 putrescine transport system substrate-binding protein [Vogesella sp. LIG4]